ncbi:MAG: glycosyltransferase family 2 protein [bacterium]
MVNWNGWMYTLECVQSLFEAKLRPFSIVVCDNNSTDNSQHHILNWARNHFLTSQIQHLGSEIEEKSLSFIPSFVFIQNPSNLGFSGGNNPGIRWALHQGCFDFIWILNNDSKVHSHALRYLYLSAKNEPKAGIFGSTIISSDTNDRLECAGGCWYEPITTVARFALKNQILSDLLKKSPKLNLDYISGVSMFIRDEVFRKVGLFNEDYFLFYEELDLCTRAKKAGFELMWSPQSIIYHKGGASIGRPGFANRKKIRLSNYHENLSTLLFTKNCYPQLLPLAMFCRFFGKLAAVTWRGEWYLIKPLVQAYMDFGTHLINSMR